MRKEPLLCKQVNQIDLVEYLEKLGFKPQKIRNNDYWYLSPLRDEKNPSFKVNRQLNVWYDHALGKGGNIVDFGISFYRCSVKELLLKLASENAIPVFFHPHIFSPAAEKKSSPLNVDKIQIVNCREIRDPSLLEYLNSRQIPHRIANQFCQEVDFELYGKSHLAIGFKNDAGGYELRNKYFKGSSSPKDWKFFDNGQSQVHVFEGFFDFLSFQSIYGKDQPPTNFLILNSLAFFEKSREIMEMHQGIGLYLDHDLAGRKHTAEACQSNAKYQDQSIHYRGCKDLNDWLIKRKLSQSNSAKLDHYRNIQTHHIKRHGRF